MNALTVQTSTSVQNAKILLNMNILSLKSRKSWKKEKIKKISSSSREYSSNILNLLMEETHLQAMRNVTEKEKDIFTIKRFGDLPLSLVDSPNNIASMLKSIKIRGLKMFSNNMLWIMECLKKSLMKSL